MDWPGVSLILRRTQPGIVENSILIVRRNQPRIVGYSRITFVPVYGPGLRTRFTDLVYGPGLRMARNTSPGYLYREGLP